MLLTKNWCTICCNPAVEWRDGGAIAGKRLHLFHEAIELIGARWTGAIVRVLLGGTTRYADIRAAVPDISDRMLSGGFASWRRRH